MQFAKQTVFYESLPFEEIAERYTANIKKRLWIIGKMEIT